MDEMLIRELRYDKEAAVKFLTPTMLEIVERHVKQFEGQTDYSMRSFDAAWEMLCHEKDICEKEKLETEMLLFSKKIYEIDLKLNEDDHRAYLQASKEIEEMAMVAMG